MQATLTALPAADQFYVAPPPPPPSDPERERQRHNASVLKEIVYWAKDEGDRVVIDGKTVWAGLGNRSGLHSYAEVVVREKWEKSGARFEKKLAALPPGTKIEIRSFRNITRDRGTWILFKCLTIR